MKNKCLVGLISWLICSALSAQDVAPEVVGNTIWEFNRIPANAPRTSLFLSSNGLAYSLRATGAPLTEPGPYAYRKTGASTAVLVLGDSGVAPYTLQFFGEGRANFESRFGSGILNITTVPAPAKVALRNVSTRVSLAAEQTSLAGFVVAGTAYRRVLVRAIGPSLAQFGVVSPAPGTALVVSRGPTELAANRGWGGTPSLAQAFTAAGAFALPPTSRDSALLLNLAPGDYVAQARADGGAGEILIEVYFIQ